MSTPAQQAGHEAAASTPGCLDADTLKALGWQHAVYTTRDGTRTETWTYRGELPEHLRAEFERDEPDDE